MGGDPNGSPLVFLTIFIFFFVNLTAPIVEAIGMFGKKKQPKEYEIWKTRVKYFQFPRFMKGIREWLEYMSGNSVGVRVEVKSYSHIYSNGDCVDITIYGPCITGMYVTELTNFIQNQPMGES